MASSPDILSEDNKKASKRENKRHKAEAQAATPATRVAGIDATDEERLTVTGHGFNTMHDSLGLSRMPQDVMHTPQNINVVPQALMR
ncbi:MAG: TonB-dependent siderophore receptor, partial [Acetobacter malorum]